MGWPHTYTRYIWPMLASATFAAVVRAYAWRRRGIPGALPLALGCLFGFLRPLGRAIEMAAADSPTRLFWTQAKYALHLPAMTSMPGIVPAYDDRGRRRARLIVILPSVPPLWGFAFSITNDAHHRWWTGLAAGPQSRLWPGPGQGTRVEVELPLAGQEETQNAES